MADFRGKLSSYEKNTARGVVVLYKNIIFQLFMSYGLLSVLALWNSWNTIFLKTE